LSLKSAKPALLNAEIAWNTPYQAARPQLFTYGRKLNVSTMAITASITNTTPAIRTGSLSAAPRLCW